MVICLERGADCLLMVQTTKQQETSDTPKTKNRCTLDKQTCYRDSVDNTVEENSSVFSLIRMQWLLSERASGQ